MSSSITTTDYFAQLMTAYGIPVDNQIAIGHTGYLDSPIRHKLFTGHDEPGRAFINLPVKVTVAPGHIDRLYSKRPNQAFIVFQRYTEANSIFTTGGSLDPMECHTLLGQNLRDFTQLVALLNGQTLRFHETKYEHGNAFDDPDRYIDIVLAPSNTTVVVPDNWTPVHTVVVTPEPLKETQPMTHGEATIGTMIHATTETLSHQAAIDQVHANISTNVLRSFTAGHDAVAIKNTLALKKSVMDPSDVLSEEAYTLYVNNMVEILMTVPDTAIPVPPCDETVETQAEWQSEPVEPSPVKKSFWRKHWLPIVGVTVAVVAIGGAIGYAVLNRAE